MKWQILKGKMAKLINFKIQNFRTQTKNSTIYINLKVI